MDTQTIKIKDFLRELRTSKKITVQKMADMLDLSKGYLSLIEGKNEKTAKNIPGKEFIINYIGSASDDADEFENNIAALNEASGLDLSIPVNYNDFSDMFGDSASAPFMHVVFEDNKLQSKKYDFRISDLNHHLTDKKNHSFYKDIKLTEDDKSAINDLIKDYLVLQITSKIEIIEHLHDTDKLDSDAYKNHLEALNKQLKDIN